MKLPLMDIIFLSLLGLLALRGLLKGFTGEFFSLASAALGLAAAFFFFRPGAVFIRARYLDTALLPEILAFAIIFLVVFIAGKILERIVTDLIKGLGLGTLDKALGFLFGLTEAAALFAAVVFLLSVQPLFNSTPLLEQSIIARFFLGFMGKPGMVPLPQGGAVV